MLNRVFLDPLIRFATAGLFHVRRLTTAEPRTARSPGKRNPPRSPGLFDRRHFDAAALHSWRHSVQRHPLCPSADVPWPLVTARRLAALRQSS
jgi:hypothetical protein